MEKKERENTELIKNRRLVLAGSAIILLCVILVFVFIYSRYRLKKQKEIDRHTSAQEQLRFQAVIEAEERERKRIASDLHDGVGQTMSAAKINLSMLQAELVLETEDQRSTMEKIVALVDESCREVRSVSHNMMPNTLLKSGLASAIRNFINQIDRRILRVDFYSEGLDAPLRSNYEVVLYRVVQECVNNVIKHSAASTLHISLIKDEEGISVTIEDNGKGFDTSKTENFDGIGLKNIQSRINYLKGTVEWNSTIGRGTAVVINIPA
jgi:signal transduction histidine kinase